MSARKSSSANPRRLTAWASLLPLLALGACADYVKHSDRITASAGDAAAHNNVVHVIDPWPRAAANTRITGNGQRIDRVTKQYLTGKSGDSSTPTVNVNLSGSPDSSSGNNGNASGSGSQP